MCDNSARVKCKSRNQYTSNTTEHFENALVDSICSKSSRESGTNFLTILPYNLSLYLFTFCDPSTLLRLSEVSWYCKLVAESNEVWKVKCQQRGWNLPDVELVSLPTKFWKRYYYEKRQLLARAMDRNHQIHVKHLNSRSAGPRLPSTILEPRSKRLSNLKSPSNLQWTLKTTYPPRNSSTRRPESRSVSFSKEWTDDRLTKVPVAYISGGSIQRSQSSCERLVSLPGNTRLAHFRPQIPWRLSHGSCRSQSTEPNGASLHWNAVRQRYTLLSKSQRSSTSSSSRAEAYSPSTSCHARGPFDQDVARHADVFGPTYVNDLDSVSQFSLWKCTNYLTRRGEDTMQIANRKRVWPTRTRNLSTSEEEEGSLPRTVCDPGYEQDNQKISALRQDESTSITESLNRRLPELSQRNKQIGKNSVNDSTCITTSITPTNKEFVTTSNKSFKADAVLKRPVSATAAIGDSTGLNGYVDPGSVVIQLCASAEPPRPSGLLSTNHALSPDRRRQLTMVPRINKIQYYDTVCILHSEHLLSFENSGLRSYVSQRKCSWSLS